MIMYLGNIVESAPAMEIYGNALHPFNESLCSSRSEHKQGPWDAGFDVE
jgi:ABC-type dipeptide/oligopeptide/nickel transport system ATPase component